MTKQLHLKESVAEAPVKKGGRWRVVVARPGQGSSGNYSEDLFRRDGHRIIAPGGQAFINHDDSRNPKDMLGVYPEGSFWDEDEKAVISELEVFSHWRDFVEEVGPHCGISLYALGEADEDGNVLSILEDRLNGADLVARPGLIGSGLAEKLYESAVSHSEEPTVTVAEQEERNKEIMEEKLDKLIELMNSLVAEKVQKEAEAAQVEADAGAIKTAVENYDAAVKMVNDAELFEAQKAEILTVAKEGKDISALVEAAKAVKKEALEAVAESASQGDAQGVVLGEAASKFGAWS